VGCCQEVYFFHIATRYRLDGPGIESRCGRDFLHPSTPALGPTHPPVQGVPCIFPGEQSRRGAVFTTHPHLVPRSKKEYGYTCTPHLGLHALFLREIYLYLYLYLYPYYQII
jgi:hypothetical protein